MSQQLRRLALALVFLAAACGTPVSGGDGGSPIPDGGCGSLDVCDNSCVDRSSDPRHCGDCATDCTALPNVIGSDTRCVAGLCKIACEGFFGNCFANPFDGCADLSQPSNCGACGVACAGPRPLCVHFASPAIGGSFRCASPCTAAAPTRCNSLCNDYALDLGCVDTQTNPLACGGCCNFCPVPQNGIATCDGGVCGYACTPPFADCDGVTSNGCETNTRSDVAHCGSCSAACRSDGGTPACDAGVCVGG